LDFVWAGKFWGGAFCDTENQCSERYSISGLEPRLPGIQIPVNQLRSCWRFDFRRWLDGLIAEQYWRLALWARDSLARKLGRDVS